MLYHYGTKIQISNLMSSAKNLQNPMLNAKHIFIGPCAFAPTVTRKTHTLSATNHPPVRDCVSKGDRGHSVFYSPLIIAINSSKSIVTKLSSLRSRDSYVKTCLVRITGYAWWKAFWLNVTQFDQILSLCSTWLALLKIVAEILRSVQKQLTTLKNQMSPYNSLRSNRSLCWFTLFCCRILVS